MEKHGLLSLNYHCNPLFGALIWKFIPAEKKKKVEIFFGSDSLGIDWKICSHFFEKLKSNYYSKVFELFEHLL